MRLALIALLVACASQPRPLQLRRVILYQNGLGYFERTGRPAGDTLELAFARRELDDVLKTLTVIDRRGGSVATVDVPVTSDRDRIVTLGVRLGGSRTHDVLVGYAVPTPTWKAAYRVVLDDDRRALLQGWAVINNASQEDWTGVQLTLATGAPFSLASDLSTPRFVERPDATGRLIRPTVLGPIEGELRGAIDTDHDGILDVEDRCPDLPGDDDDDGCPDRGRLVVSSSSLVVLEPLHFERGTDVLPASAAPIVAAVASALRTAPEITLLEIAGHASGDEPEAWGLAARRATAVRAALIAQGIAADRLTIAPYGATQPGGHKPVQQRRVEFLILKRTSAAGAASAPVLDARAVQASTRTRSTPAAVAGTVRYQLTEPVTIRRGATSMVSILNQSVAGEEALLFRPDPAAPGSERHPFRVVRLDNASGYTLEPGPVAIFAGGSFVGDGLLSRLELGETAWIPYALDGATRVTVATDDAERPVRLIAIRRGVATVETAGIRTTRYTIAAGRDAPRTIFVRHAPPAGFTPAELPPDTIDQGGAYLLPVPLQGARTATLVVEDREARTRSVALLDGRTTELSMYLEHAPAEIVDRLRDVIALREQLAAIDDRAERLRTRIADLAQRAGEQRDSLRTLEKVATAAELRRTLLAGLGQTTRDADTAARALTVELEAAALARGKLADAISTLSLDSP
jgi:outer membrane protein OmpA-like peptidoglycan-associated protein